MAKRSIELGKLVSREPRKAASQIRQALATHGGNLTWTAEQLGVDVSTLRRWVSRLNRGGHFREVLTQIQDDWTGRRRRPRGYGEKETAADGG